MGPKNIGAAHCDLTWRFCFLSLLLAIAAHAAIAQAPISIPESEEAKFVPPNTVQPWTDNPFTQPPTFALLPQSAGSPHGNVWVRSSKAGLVIWGRVETGGDPIRWPQQKSDMLASTHLEIWLSTSAGVSMPQVGFGNQFGPVTFKTADDCKGEGDHWAPDNDAAVAGCRRWFEQQVSYRTQLKRLFVRQWLISDSHSFEDFASSAYASLRNTFFEDSLPQILAPKTDDGFRAEIRPAVQNNITTDASGHRHNEAVTTGYEFHVLIPYAAFPPAPELALRDLWVMVDAFNAAAPGHKMGAFSTTSTHRQWGSPATFNHVSLEKSASVSITPCGYQLEEEDVYGTKYPAWYLPARNEKTTRLIDSDFALMNSASGYEYEPGSMSPLVKTFPHFSRKLPDGSTVCGPDLAFVNGNTRGKSQFEIDKDHLESHRLPDGWLLLRSGPTLTIQNPHFGSGQCGACDVEMMQVYAISPAGQISKALDLSDRIAGNEGDPDAVDYAFSADWSRIVYYTDIAEEQSEDGKTHTMSVTYCLGDHRYEKCAQSNDAKLPNPPNFKSPELAH